MSLKKFHVFFITVSVGLCAFFGVWCVVRYREAGGFSYAGLAALSAGAVVGLVVYELWFLKKMRGVNGP
jgi:hypothetical protein